ncbi:hypothetical protein AQI84_34095 [Streptomyces griseorubiginosus]|nr:hypothetical protein AQI84_34095 [Streptomyces griseorubiginosus]
MPYVIIGLMGLFAGRRALVLRGRRLEGDAAPASSGFLRPAVLAVLAGVAIACGLFLLVIGAGVLYLS